MQQGFGWDTTHIQTNATQYRISLDQHHLLAQIGGAKSRSVAAGAAAQHQYFSV